MLNGSAANLTAKLIFITDPYKIPAANTAKPFVTIKVKQHTAAHTPARIYQAQQIHKRHPQNRKYQTSNIFAYILPHNIVKINFLIFKRILEKKVLMYYNYIQWFVKTDIG